ncbi:hypothetical protein OEZ86_011953 [Tetradesmus obliquus]|nr:hypothetical protein OEZ86_011953 [Tetradesmus obliquus]
MAWPQYTWLIVVHGIVAFLDAYGIGANDVANAFGTSVGSKTLVSCSGAFICKAAIKKLVVFGGSNAVVWYEPKADFPYALITFVLFLAVRTLVLRRAESTTIAFYVLPLLILLTLFINLFFILTKGVKGIVTISAEKGAWLAAAGAAGARLIGTAIIWPLMKRSLLTFDTKTTNSIEAGKGVAAGGSAFQEEDAFQKAVSDKLKPVHVDADDKSLGAMFKRFRNAALSGITHDIHADVKHDEAIMEMHDAAEKFDPRTEHVFKVLQVISACAMSFAHGANDVANAIGSFCASLYVYNNLQPQTMELISARNFAMANTNATLGRLSALNAAAAAPNASLTEQINAVNASLLGLGNLNGKTWLDGGALQKTFQSALYLNNNATVLG